MQSLIRSMMLGAAALALVAAPASAQTGEYYKGKTLTVLVGLNAGGTVDLFARLFSQYIQQASPRPAQRHRAEHARRGGIARDELPG